MMSGDDSVYKRKGKHAACETQVFVLQVFAEMYLLQLQVGKLHEGDVKYEHGNF